MQLAPIAEKISKGDSIVTRLDLFKREMEPAKELYTSEISDFAKNFNALGEMTLTEEPDIDTMDYIYSFKCLNGTSQEELDNILLKICNHMDEFSRVNGIEKFCRNVIIWL